MISTLPLVRFRYLICFRIYLNNIKYLFIGQCLFHPKDQDKWGIPPHPVGNFSSLWIATFLAGVRFCVK